MFQPPTLQWTLQGLHPPSSLITHTEMKHAVKRKMAVSADTTLVPPPPEKHFVTEEEMTAEMRRLYIVEPQFVHTQPPIVQPQPPVMEPQPQFVQQQPQFPAGSPYFQDRGQETTLSPFTFNSAGQFNGFGFPCVSECVQQSDFVELKDVEVEDSMEETAALPKLFVSEEVLKIKPTPALPPSLLCSSPRHQLALVPWVPPIWPPKPDEEEKKSQKEDEMDMC